MNTPEYTAIIFRHGYTRYWQSNGPRFISEAYDLAMPPKQEPETERDLAERVREAEEQVFNNACRAIRFLSRDLSVTLLSSPTGRGLHSAKVIASALNHADYVCAEIVPMYGLTEVRNFSWELFFPLCLGGEVKWSGGNFVIDKTFSNPESLSLGEYFRRDCLHELPDSVTSRWPAKYVATIRSFERSTDVRKRTRAVLRETMGFGMQQTILVTHDGLSGFIVKAFTRGTRDELEKGSFLVLAGNPQKLTVKAVGTETNGDLETNVLSLP